MTAAPPEPPYSVGQVADLLGIQPAFLRRLDRVDAVSPARSEGQQRRYSAADVARVRDVVSLMGEGLTVEGARRVLELQAEVARLRGELAALRRRRARSDTG